MNNEELRSYWSSKEERVITYSTEILNKLDIREHAANFLQTIGLPAEAAPFISFNENTSDEWNSINRLSNFAYDLDSSFSKFIQIGSDGSGNPIVIDTGDSDSIKLSDHDNSFSLHFINSGIESFSHSLAAYSMFIDAVLSQNDDDAYFDTHFTDEQFEALKASLILADANFDKSDFWQNELNTLITNREQHRQEIGD